jgi:pantoate--beta-alanine ligase
VASAAPKTADAEASPVLDIVRTVADLRVRVAAWRKDGNTVALVPTMGALHQGHLELVRAAAGSCDRVVVSLFVNPTQFGPSEDYRTYPRDEATDSAMVAGAGASLLYAPTVEEMYPDGFATAVTVSGLTEGLCGAHRPGHFQGVATVVAKLLTQCAPDRAFFGEKDYQQLLVIKRLVRDLDLPVDIVGVPTVREDDGLAMSSRNAYLDPGQRAIAGKLNAILADAAARAAAGAEVAAAEAHARAELEATGFDSIDYVEIRDAETLEPVSRVTRPARILAAVRLGRARLIDNLPIQPAAGPSQ